MAFLQDTVAGLAAVSRWTNVYDSGFDVTVFLFFFGFEY